MKLKVLFLVAAATLALAACKPAEKPAEETPAAETAPAAEVTAPAAEPAAPAATAPVADTATATASTGVPECDTYLEKVYACISDKVPEAQRAAMKQSIEQTQSGWSTVTDKTALATQCKSAMEQAKTSFGAMGCTF